ncbi:MAG: metallophosphoesterase [Enterocloster asparagiformis]|nr:metallophosphoesterase [Enterocloster asparagiformis]
MHYVCADIHGKWDKYQAMLAGLRMGPEDRLYILGDVIDRGEDGVRILQDILGRGNISLFMGNHELFLYICIRTGPEDWVNSWMHNGGKPTAERFLNLTSGEQDEIMDLLENSYAAIPDLCVEGRHYYLVHAYPDLHYLDGPVRVCDMGEDEIDRLYDMVWRRASDQQWKGDLTLRTIWEMGRRALIGHTITTSFCRFNCDDSGRARIFRDKYFTGLDCGCAINGAQACLGVLRLEDEKEFYF